jgi:hypothetical protein
MLVQLPPFLHRYRSAPDRPKGWQVLVNTFASRPHTLRVDHCTGDGQILAESLL